MIFSELYSAYYNTVAKIIKEALIKPVSRENMRKIIDEHAFSESFIAIEQAFDEQRWQLLYQDGTTPLRNPPDMPLTTLQKRWLKAISLDSRIRLFGDAIPDLLDVSPLFTPDDYCVFDKYSDGDNFDDEDYIAHFRLILDAVNNGYPLSITMNTKSGKRTHINAMPNRLEYSEKDDKFRMIVSGCRNATYVNLGRIISCTPYGGSIPNSGKSNTPIMKTVTFELVDERNALERVMMHFAHFEKQAERIDDKYRVTLKYDKDDETEIVIRILSFGPFVKVIEPEMFVELIKDRLIKQKSCGLF